MFWPMQPNVTVPGRKRSGERTRATPSCGRPDSQKWYALVMDVPRDKLRIPGPGSVDVLNVKCDPILGGSLRLESGILPAYHMNKDSWLTLLLDGTVPRETVFALLDGSYRLTGPHAAGMARAPGKQTWIFPANPRRYDLAAAFARDPEILWRQRNRAAAGDTVYLYLTVPIASILYRCEVLEVDLPCPWEDRRGPDARALRMKLRGDIRAGCAAHRAAAGARHPARCAAPGSHRRRWYGLLRSGPAAADIFLYRPMRDPAALYRAAGVLYPSGLIVSSVSYRCATL